MCTVITAGGLAGIQQWTEPVITGCGHCWRQLSTANSDHCWENFPQIRTVVTVRVRFDCVKYSGEHEAGGDSDDDGDNTVTYSLGIAMLVFRISSPAFGNGEGEGFRDFFFVRQMKPADRKGAGELPKHPWAVRAQDGP